MPRNNRRDSTLASAPAPAAKDRRRISRREREARNRRILTVGMIVVVAVVAVIVLASTLNWFVIQPNGTLATVNGHTITRSDYWKVRRNLLFDRIQQYSFQAQLGQGSNQQLQAAAETAQNEIKGIRTYPVDPVTLRQMVEDQTILDALPSIGVTITQKDIDETVAERFAPVRLNTATPEPTLNPTRQATAAAATAAATTTAVAISAGATTTAQAGATQTATVTALTPTANTPPTATAPPPATAVPSQTPTNSEARATSTANLDEFVKNRQKNGDISLDDYKRLIIRPALARQRAREVLEARSPTRGEQIRAFHILVPTEEAAREARRRVVEGGQDFAAVAMELSTDTTTKPNGGDLGYAPRGLFVKPFEDAAFALPVGGVSDVVKTEFGYHVIKVTERVADREFDDAVFRQLRDKQFQSWIDEQMAKAKIVQEGVPTPIPSPASGFQAPAGAPATPTFTPAPTVVVSGTPGSDAAVPGVTTVPGAASGSGAGGSGGAATMGTPAGTAAMGGATMPTPAASAAAPAVQTTPAAITPTGGGAATMPGFVPPTIVAPTAIAPMVAATMMPMVPAPPTVAPPTLIPVPTVASAPPAMPSPTVAMTDGTGGSGTTPAPGGTMPTAVP